MGFWKSFAGQVRVRITSGSVERIMNVLITKGIVLNEVTLIDSLTIELTILRRTYRILRREIQRHGDKIEIIERYGLYWRIKAIVHRPVLITGIVLYIILSVYLPTRVLFVDVEGNNLIDKEMIITQAETCGIHFGASRKSVRNEHVKNALLSAVPQLQWVGVNTFGCVAVISVQERTETDFESAVTGIQSIVARYDSVVKSVVSTKGNVMCQPGQAVKAGQVLISGYTDCGISIKATSAQGEVYGFTRHCLKTVAPDCSLERKDILNAKTCYSLIFGKKLIKLYNDSGISDTSCVKMNKVSYLRLPGGYQLPVALMSERIVTYDTERIIVSQEKTAKLCQEQSDRYLKDQMLAGEILFSQPQIYTDAGRHIFSCDYGCVEMIGQVYNEEIIIADE